MNDNDLRVEIGKLGGGIDAIRETIANNREDRKDFERRILEMIVSLRHEQRNANQVLSGRLELLAVEQQRTQRRLEDVERDLKGVKEDLAQVKGPVDELVSLRQRIGALVVMIMSGVMVVWTVAQPFISAAADRLFELLWKR